MPNQSNQIYQIKVTLKGTRPPIWRRILVPANTTLLKLHDILQIVMGWDDYHMHLFTIDGQLYGEPMDDEFGVLKAIDEARVKLKQVITREGQRFSYLYDFGDYWEHTLLVEKFLPPQKGVQYPICLKGKLASPPEDIGGVWGYYLFLEAIRNPDHDQHEDYVAWIGGKFDPEAFDLTKINSKLGNMERGIGTESESSLNGELSTFDLGLVSPLPQPLPRAHEQAAEELPLRRDMIALLTYLRDNKVVGTQATGNFPLKAVREISAQFADPPPMEYAIGEKVYPVRSEADVWPLYFRHVLASTSSLIAGGLGRRWTLTRLGESFLAAPATIQVWYLLASWWTVTNWMIASPIELNDGMLPPGFTMSALRNLLEIPSGEMASFDQFADRMIANSKLVWPIQDQETAQFILRSSINFMVINPLVDFGILRTEYKPHSKFGPEFRELSTIQITPFGRVLLETIHDAMKR